MYLIKYYNRQLYILLVAISIVSVVHAQHEGEIISYPFKTECVTEDMYQQEIKPVLAANRQMLIEKGILQPLEEMAINTRSTGPSVPLYWPLRMVGDYSSIDGVFSYYALTNYTDMNSEDVVREDWMCALGEDAINYDNHNGADIIPYPFTWKMKADESVDVISAANGTVLGLYRDCSFDNNCATPHILCPDAPFGGGYYGNYVIIEHDDATVTIYAHMKSGSVSNAFEVGDYLPRGTFLGKIGSSGNSTGPHLHFEVRQTFESSFFEPWFAADGCNFDIDASWWENQKPYHDTGIVRVTTNWDVPYFGDCAEHEAGSIEIPRLENHFDLGSTIKIYVFVRHWETTDNFTLRIKNVSGTDLAVYNSSAVPEFYLGATYNYSWNSSGYSASTYNAEVEFEGKKYSHYFTLGCPSSYTFTSGSHTGERGYLASSTVTSAATISGVSTNNVVYEAGSSITLNAGFNAASGCGFKARIDGCTIGGLKTSEDIVLNENEEVFNIFPNPSDGIVQVQYASGSDSEFILTVKNYLGEIVLPPQDFDKSDYLSQAIDLSQFPKGMYIIELHAGNDIKTKSVIIQ